MRNWKLMIVALALAGVVTTQAQVSGQITINLTAEQFDKVKMALAVYNAENNTNLNAVQWADLVATKAIVEEADKVNTLAARSVLRRWAKLTDQERLALLQRIAEIDAAEAQSVEP